MTSRTTHRPKPALHFERFSYNVRGTDREIAKIAILVWLADSYSDDGRSYERGHVRFEWHAEYPEQGRLSIESSIWASRETLALAARLQAAYAKLGADRTISGVEGILSRLKARKIVRVGFDAAPVAPEQLRPV